MLVEKQQLRRCECRRSEECMGAVPAPDGFVVSIDGKLRFACLECRNYIASRRR